MALMNMFLHNIGDINDEQCFIASTDALIAPSPLSVDYVLANPPFGKKISLTFTGNRTEKT
jgi:type I restriction enzyme M protein